jgi:adenylosuccinate lyase
MEIIEFKAIIIAFVVLLTAIVIMVMVLAANYGKHYRLIKRKSLYNEQLVEVMTEEREQNDRITRLLKDEERNELTRLN